MKLCEGDSVGGTCDLISAAFSSALSKFEVGAVKVLFGDIPVLKGVLCGVRAPEKYPAGKLESETVGSGDGGV